MSSYPAATSSLERRLRAFCVSLAAHCHRIVVVQSCSSPSHPRRPIVVIILDDVNVDVIVIVVVIVITAVVFHFPIVIVAIATILVFGVVVVAVAVIINIVACRRRACRAPWLSIQGIRQKQAKAVSPMAWGWSACGSPLPYRDPAMGTGIEYPHRNG